MPLDTLERAKLCRRYEAKYQSLILGEMAKRFKSSSNYVYGIPLGVIEYHVLIAPYTTVARNTKREFKSLYIMVGQDVIGRANTLSDARTFTEQYICSGVALDYSKPFVIMGCPMGVSSEVLMGYYTVGKKVTRRKPKPNVLYLTKRLYWFVDTAWTD